MPITLAARILNGEKPATRGTFAAVGQAADYRVPGLERFSLASMD
jgi:hypothetical protein